MKIFIHSKSVLSLTALLLLTPQLSADAGKVVVLENCDRIDPKAMHITDCKGKAVETKDPAHTKVLDIVFDYAKPGANGNVGRDFPPHTDLKKLAAIRFWVRSDNATTFGLRFAGKYTRKDGKGTSFSGGNFSATDTWTQIIVPFEKITRVPGVVWDKAKNEKVNIPGGDVMDDEDFSGLKNWYINSGINSRGNSTTGHLQIDSVEMVEK
jgi:hypothetical protein